jgi:hypothetical protein
LALSARYRGLTYSYVKPAPAMLDVVENMVLSPG